MSRPTKVFLTRSNQTPENDYQKVRNLLLKNYDCKVIEWDSSKSVFYNNTNIEECDVLVIVPPVGKDEDNDYPIGKGQFSILDVFADERYDFDNAKWNSKSELAVVVSEIGDKYLYCEAAIDWHIQDEDNYKAGYGYIITEQCNFNLSEWISLSLPTSVLWCNDKITSSPPETVIVLKPMLAGARLLKLI